MAWAVAVALLAAGCVAVPDSDAFPAADDLPPAVSGQTVPAQTVPDTAGRHGQDDASGTDTDDSAPVSPSISPRSISGPDQTLRASSGERQAKEMTVRVRTTGCGSLGTGSGFAIGDGLIVTNRHVVAEATEISLNTWDGGSIEAQLHGIDVTDDLAVVRIDRTLPSAGDLAADDPSAGTGITVVGYPLGGHLEFTRGDVVDYARLDTSEGPRVLRLSAEIWPGNSGGPVLDDAGRVVGVVFAIERGTDYALAVPVSQLHELLDRGLASADAPAPHCSGA